MAILELIGGPLDGVIHEVDGEWPVPDALALCSKGDLTVRHWYLTDENLLLAFYCKSEATDK